MLKINNYEVVGWDHAIQGMRNPMNSWDKCDSVYGCSSDGNLYECARCAGGALGVCSAGFVSYIIGENDHNLMKKLSQAGTDHRKFMRMITVYVDITAPLYWWKEFDTYKVGTVANSCSTMHKIHEKEFTVDDFSCEFLNNWDCGEEYASTDGAFYNTFQRTVEQLNVARKYYLETNAKKYWWQMIQLLPSSYNQKRTVMLNYEVLANIYKSRRNHKLDEWHTLCDWIEKLPESGLIVEC